MSHKTIFSNLKGLAGALFWGGLLAGATMALPACKEEDPNADRKEFIEVYGSKDQEEPQTTYHVGVQGGLSSFYVKSNVEFSATWQDDESSPWGKVVSVEKSGEDGLYVVQIQTQPRSTIAYYTRRTGTLMLTAPELSLGTYVTIHQGLYPRLSCDFSWSKYGSADPRKDDGTIYSSWSQTNLDRGWTSTTIAGTDGPYLYAKNGYLLLGDADGHGADLFTPYVNDMASDSLLVVTFRAVGYTDLEGTKDANKFTVEVVGGGVFRDAAGTTPQTKLDIEIPYYDMTDEAFPTSMWTGTDFLLGVISAPGNEISGNTRIRFTAGDMSGVTGTPNRVFMDNIYIRRIYESKTYVDEDLWKVNGGNGADKILGVVNQ